MSDNTVEIIENSNILEITSSTESETSVVEIVQSGVVNLEMSTSVALLPSSFEDNTKVTISETLVGGSGIVIGPLTSGNILISTSGLQPSGNYSLVGHSHNSSDITNFNSSVSGLLPVKNISAGSGIGVSNSSGDFTVSVTGTFGLTGEQVDDRVSNLLKSGSYVNLDYNDSLDSLTISVTGLQPSGNYSLLGHSHNISDITNLQTILDSKQASGVYASGIHYHTSSDITSFDSSVSGLLPVKNISSGSGISVTNNSGDFTVAVTGQFGLTSEEVDDRVNDLLIAGSNIVLNYDDLANQLTISTSGLQSSGNYSTVGHSHVSSDITDFNSGVSGLLPVKNISSGSYTSISSFSGDFTISVTGVQPSGNYSVVGHTHISTDISDSTAAGRNLLTSPDSASQNKILWEVPETIIFNAKDGGHYYISESLQGVVSFIDPASPGVNTFYKILSFDNDIIINIGNIPYTNTKGKLFYRKYNFIIGAWETIQDNNHTHTSSQITNFASSVNSLVSGIYAPLNSPALTGIPTAPTAPSGTNDTQIANTSFVRTEISNLVDSAPITLDTLNELAAALGDDPNFATTVTNLIGNKVSKSGDTMTGTLYAPSGVFSSVLTLNGTTVSVSGHTHSYSDITNFASGVSDSLTTTLLAGSFIALDYNSSLDTLTISATGLQPSGNYSVVGHSHTASDITDFNSSVSGLLPVKNVLGSGYVNVSSSSGNYTISVSGLQPSGNYANSVHTHTASDITDFSSSVSGLIPVKDIIAGNDISISSSSGIYTINSAVTSVDEANSLVTTVFNKTGSTIPKMSVVYINGGQGDMPTVQLAIATTEATSSKTYGITAEAIDHMSTGKVVVDGALTGLNTDQFNPTAPTGDVNGTVVYLSPSVSGAITTTKPYAPNHLVSVGTIVRTHQNEGVIEVKIQNGFELQELHNVAVTGVNNGQFLQYNSTSNLWVPTSSGNFTTLQLNGTGVSVSGHTHTSSNITDFNSSVSGLLPSVSGSGYVNSSFNNNVYTISVTGLQPSGNYASAAHTHILNDLSNINGNRGDISVSNSGITWVLNSGVINTQHLNNEIIIDCGLILAPTPTPTVTPTLTPTPTPTPIPIASDPYFAQVNLLAHFNSTNNSTTFTDSSSFNRTLTRTGSNAVISTTQSKFGGSSLYLGSTNGDHYLSSNNITVGIQNYVIEGWFYFNSLTGLNRALFGWSLDNLYISALSNKLIITEGESDNVSGSATLVANTWHHIAWVRRYNTNVVIYCDGIATLTITANESGRSTNFGSIPVTVGGGSVSYYKDKNFYIDDFRVTVGQARYTGNFTPPTTPFEDS